MFPQAQSSSRGADGFFRWLVDPEQAFRRWLGIHSIVASWLALALAVLNPPQGTGVTVCWMKALTGMPCPGCGLTRSLSCALHGLWWQSWQYHPFGIPLLLLFLATIVIGHSPRSWRERLQRCMKQHALVVNLVYILFVGLFIAYALVRSLTYLLTNSHFS